MVVWWFPIRANEKLLFNGGGNRNKRTSMKKEKIYETKEIEVGERNVAKNILFCGNAVCSSIHSQLLGLYVICRSENMLECRK